MEQNEKWKKVRKVLINKYAITLYVFAVILLFIGDQSWVKQMSRALEIREVKRNIEQVKTETAAQEQLLRNLEHVDSLEKFAREEYHMHAAGEDVYLIE